MASCASSTDHSHALVQLAITSPTGAVVGCFACGFVMAVNLDYPNQTVELARSMCVICPANEDGTIVATHTVPTALLETMREYARKNFDEYGFPLTPLDPGDVSSWTSDKNDPGLGDEHGGTNFTLPPGFSWN